MGMAGVESTFTSTNPLSVHPFNAVSTLYMPPTLTGAPGIVGSSKVDEKLFGPDHVNVSPAESGLAVSKSRLPEHIGLLLPAVTIGKGRMAT
jgi:hypothetical protein